MWYLSSYRTPCDEITGSQILSVPLGVFYDGEGGVRGGVETAQFLQCLAVLLQSLNGSGETLRKRRSGNKRGGQLRLERARESERVSERVSERESERERERERE